MRTYTDTINYIFSYITDRKHLKTDPQTALARPKYLLKLLGNPQEKIKVIHVAGTSGKGSTSYLINLLLQSQGFKVGLSVSPHIIDIRERCQINNSFISKKEFVETFQKIIPAIEKTNRSKWGRTTYFEIMIAFAFYLFWKKKIDFAVMETGLGGLYDGTNVVQNPQKISVITRIGLDHQWFLGNTYPEIAFHKAGIIQERNNVITIDQKKSVIDVFTKRTENKHGQLFIIDKNNINNISVSKGQTVFDFKFQSLSLPQVHLGLLGYHQAENAGEALATLQVTSSQFNFKLNTQTIYQVLKTASVPGRFEIVRGINRDLVVDGAHNPQKMKTFIKSLIAIYPNTKFDFLISFSSGKDLIQTMKGMLKQIIPHANHVYLTSFTLVVQDSRHKAVAFSRIETILSKLDFKRYSQINNPKVFIKQQIKKKDTPFVITGSLYLVSSLYATIQKIKTKTND